MTGTDERSTRFESAIFRYPRGRAIFLHTLHILNGLMFAGFSLLCSWYLLAHRDADVVGSLWFIFVFALVSAANFYAELRFYRQSRPIQLCEDTIEKFVFENRPWEEIAWKDVTKIVKRRYYNTLFSRHEATFTIFGRGSNIKFESAILELPRLLNLVNLMIERYHIRTVASDVGVDTRRRFAAMPPSPERTKIMRHGLEKSVSKLTYDDIEP